MVKVLKTIIENYGINILRDGRVLLAYYADLAPKQVREYKMLESLVKCNGNIELLDVLQCTPSEQESRFKNVMDKLGSQLLISPEMAFDICSLYWNALGMPEMERKKFVLNTHYVPPNEETSRDEEFSINKKDSPHGGTPANRKVIVAIVTIIAVLTLCIVISSSSNKSDSMLQDETSYTKGNVPQSTSSTVNTEDRNALEEIITGEAAYTGILKVDGLSCWLELEKTITFQDVDSKPVTSNRLLLDENDSETFRGYNGLTVTLKGTLFNYRGGGTLMFNDTPEIINVVGTPDIAAPSPSYLNWDTTDNQTKFFDAIEVMKTIVYKCDSVWNVRSGCSQDTLDRIASNGFSGFDAVTLSINGSWITEFGYEAYLSLDKDYVYIVLGPSNSPDIPLFTYTWSGEFVSGEMPLDQFLIKEGLV